MKFTKILKIFCVVFALTSAAHLAAMAPSPEEALEQAFLRWKSAMDRLGGAQAERKESCANPACPQAQAGQVVKLQKCGACKKVGYCSQVCQKADWKVHKPGCQKQKYNFPYNAITKLAIFNVRDLIPREQNRVDAERSIELSMIFFDNMPRYMKEFEGASDVAETLERFSCFDYVVLKIQDFKEAFRIWRLKYVNGLDTPADAPKVDAQNSGLAYLESLGYEITQESPKKDDIVLYVAESGKVQHYALMVSESHAISKPGLDIQAIFQHTPEFYLEFENGYPGTLKFMRKMAR